MVKHELTNFWKLRCFGVVEDLSRNVCRNMKKTTKTSIYPLFQRSLQAGTPHIKPRMSRPHRSPSKKDEERNWKLIQKYASGYIGKY